MERQHEPGATGRVVLAGAPLGQVGDASARLRSALAEATVIAAEDTRRLRRLASDLGIQLQAQVLSFFEGNEQGRVPQLVELLLAGADVLVVTDAGMPSVSDPGYRLVVAALEHGIEITVLPGPSAVTAALAVSGLPVDRFCFEGFLPRKAGARTAALQQLAGERRTLVFFEAPHRLGDTLAAMAEAFGSSRRAAVCRELTKTYEEVRRGDLSDLVTWAAGDVRGEITVVVAGVDRVELGPDTDLAAEVAERELAGLSRKDAITEVARDLGVAKRSVYDAVIAAKPAR